MSKRRITRPQVIKALTEAVQARGEEYVYPDSGEGCTYRWTGNDELQGHGVEGEPACIVGVVFDHFKVLDDLVSPARNSQSLRTFVSDTERVFTESAVRVLRKAQLEQDTGAAWGRAVERAVKAA